MKIEDIKDEIQYIEIFKGRILVHTEDECFKIKHKGKFKDLLKHLPKKYKMCSFDCIVNDNLVKEYDFIGNSFTLKSGKTVELLAKSYNLSEYL